MITDYTGENILFNLFPLPKKINLSGEESSLAFPLKLTLPDFIEKSALESVCPDAFEFTEDFSDILFFKKLGLKSGYEISAEKTKISIFYENSCGAFYALVTLWQIFKSETALHCFEIEDCPVLENRGFMLDISRGRVPKASTVKCLIDILARFKYNQLQLYVEGFSLMYPSFEKYCSESSSLNADEIREISAYCKMRFIELVPNQNSLGHMAPWLAQKEFSHIAECPGGFSYGGFKIPSTTLDPENEEAFDLVRKITEDLQDAFESDKIHMGLDEPFELGRGRSSGKDIAQVYVNYIKRLNGLCKNNGKSMMMWSDAVQRFNCFEKDLPRDITYLEWGYEKEHPFDERCKKFSDRGLNFYVCPGTSSWMSFTGLTENMIINIQNAVNAAVKYGAAGILLTDWGDCNHMQPLPVSYAGIVLCGSLSWNPAKHLERKNIAKALNLYAFMDKNEIMGDLALEAGDYYQLEEVQLPCRTLAHLFYCENIKSRLKYTQSLTFVGLLMKVLALPQVSQAYLPVLPKTRKKCIDSVLKLTSRLKEKLKTADMQCADKDIIRQEYLCAISAVELFTKCRQCLNQRTSVKTLGQEASELAEKYKLIWLERNKKSSIDIALESFFSFDKQRLNK